MRLHTTWVSLFVGILLVACQQSDPTTLGPEVKNPLVPAAKPDCGENPTHPSCKDDGEDEEGGMKADALVELSGGYVTPEKPFPVDYTRRDFGGNPTVSFLSLEDRLLELNIPKYEKFSVCRGSSDTDPDFDPEEQEALWNAIVDDDPETPPANPAVRNYFARVDMDPGTNSSRHPNNRINGGHETVDASGDEIRWIYRLGTSPLFEEVPPPLGTWDPDKETITLTEGVIHFTKWNMTDGTRTRVACVNQADLVVSISNRCDNEDPACGEL